MEMFDVQVGGFHCECVSIATHNDGTLVDIFWKVHDLQTTVGVQIYYFTVSAYKHSDIFTFYIQAYSKPNKRAERLIYYRGYNVQSLDPVEGIQLTLQKYLEEMLEVTKRDLNTLNK